MFDKKYLLKIKHANIKITVNLKSLLMKTVFMPTQKTLHAVVPQNSFSYARLLKITDLCKDRCNSALLCQSS